MEKRRTDNDKDWMLSTEDSKAARKRSRNACLVCLFLILATAAIYGQVGRHGFSVLDDDDYMVRNTRVQAGLTWDGFVWAMTTNTVANWHPLTWLSHMLDCQIFGAAPGPQHLVNAAFHGVNCVLLFLILWFMTGAFWRSAFVAALFAVHPLHVESVAWISERKDVLSTFFWLVTMAAYLHYVRRPGIARYALVVVPYALGLMAKPMLVTLPCVLLLLDYWPLGRMKSEGGRGEKGKKGKGGKGEAPGARAGIHPSSFILHPSFRLILEKLPLFALSVASSVITFVVQQHGGAVRSLDAMPLSARLGNAAVAYVRYLGKTIWPQRLCIHYPHEGAGVPIWQIAACLILLAAITALVLRSARRYPYLAVGWLWFIGTLVPVIGIVQVGSQAIADRYMYVPIIGLFIILAWGAWDFGFWILDFGLKGKAVVAEGLGVRVPSKKPKSQQDKRQVAPAIPDPKPETRNPRPYLALSASAIVVLLGVAATIQTRYWQDNVALFQHAVDITSDNDVGEFNLGIALKRAGRLDEAAEHFREAVRIRRNYTNAHIYLGLIAYEQHNYDEAVQHYHDALEFAAGHPNHADALNNLGAALFAQGKFDEAAQNYQKAIQIATDSAFAQYNLGNTLRSLGRIDEAAAHFREALRLEPGHGPARNALDQLAAQPASARPAISVPKLASAEEYFSRGNTLAEEKKYAEAAAYYEEALRLKPDFADARVNLGNALALQGRLRDAVSQFRDAIQRQPNNADACVNLGNALSELGDLDAAIAAYAQAVQIRPTQANVRCSLGYTLAKRGKVEEALQEFRKALALDPQSKGAREAIRQIEEHLKQK